MLKRSVILREALAELRREHRQIAPPPVIGIRLQSAARARRRSDSKLRWAGAIAAAFLIALVSWRASRNTAAPTRVPAIRPETAVQAETGPQATRQIETPRKRLASRKRVLRAPRPAPTELATDFFPVPGSEVLPPPATLRVLRVEIAKSELRQYGFDAPAPIDASRIHADLAIGEDGLARAVRLIQ